ncbi:flavodoxin [Alteromonas sp. 345S023]|uniref:Flavodoxin n=1 Tax=Alteromonas profundi TaxID=2696062 RepID=A0A7X5RKH1_9ALTE|nr:DnaT-like ssDNA-binding domain-containing protein [Alteromonas profundi]NDV90872.1 flavodoxin [Alteromonas profundi]
MSHMLTHAELAALTSSLSNDARVLYMLGLRPNANSATTTSAPIDYKALLVLLNGDDKDTPYQRGRQINSLLRQLEQNGLVALPDAVDLAHSVNGKILLLPLISETQNSFSALHKSHFSMSASWQPNASLFKEMAQLLGIIDAEYDNNDIGEFIAYWLGRPSTVFSEFQWTQKFAYNIKRKRLASGYEPVRKVGNQHVKVAAGIEADDNARKLVEKYATSSKKS